MSDNNEWEIIARKVEALKSSADIVRMQLTITKLLLQNAKSSEKNQIICNESEQDLLVLLRFLGEI